MRLDSIKMHGATVKKKIIFWRSTVLISGCTLVILNKVSHSFLRYLQQNLWTKTQTTPQLFTVTTYIVPCSRLLLGKFSSSANQQNSPCFMETEVSLRVHNISTSLPMPSQINPVHSPKPIEYPFYYYPPIYTLVIHVVSFPQASPPKPCMHLS